MQAGTETVSPLTSGQPERIADWLEGVGPGLSLYKAAFDDIGISDRGDLSFLDAELTASLEETLGGIDGGKILHVRKIMAAVRTAEHHRSEANQDVAVPMPMEMTSSPNSMEVKQGICLSDKRILGFCALVEFFAVSTFSIMRLFVYLASYQFSKESNDVSNMVLGFIVFPSFTGFFCVFYAVLIFCRLRASRRACAARAHILLIVASLVLSVICAEAPKASRAYFRERFLLSSPPCSYECVHDVSHYIDKVTFTRAWMIDYTVVPLYYQFAVQLPFRVLIAHPLLESPTASFWS